MTIFIGTSGGNKEVKDPKVGDAGSRRDVQRAWVGTSGGNKLVYTRASVTVTATATGTSTATVSWTTTAGAVYNLYRTGGPQATGPLLLNSTAASFNETGLLASSTYSYRVDVVMGGQVVASGTASTTTSAVQFVQRTVDLSAVSSATFNGAGSNRGIAECYYGRYSGTHGRQKSLWCFNIPADLRNCVSIDLMQIAVWNTHHYQSSGGRFGLVVHHGAYQGGFPGTFPGSTGLVVDGAGNIPAWTTPKSGWMGDPLIEGAWLSLLGFQTPGRASVADEFRLNGAHGFGLAAPDDSLNWYGYAMGASQANKPRLRIVYTVRV
jgi:hypothetical protein